MYNATSPTISLTDARAHLRELLERVKGGEEITLTQDGTAVAVLVRPDRLRSLVRSPALELGNRVGRRIDAHHLDPPPLDDLPAGGLTSGDAERLITGIRADRDRS